MPTLNEVQARNALERRRAFLDCSKVLGALSKITPRTLAEIALMFAESSTSQHYFSDVELKNCLNEQIKLGVVLETTDGYRLK